MKKYPIVLFEWKGYENDKKEKVNKAFYLKYFIF